MTRHWPALDGLRAAAVLSVMIYHLTWEVGAWGQPNILAGGYLGVDVFFVLSGFLITWLLIHEWDSRKDSISFRDFYARRILRLLPALSCVAAAAVLLSWVLDRMRIGAPVAAGSTLSGIPWVAAFLGNWNEAIVGGGHLGLLSHTWSLAVEEQFYLLWPVLFVLLSRRGVGRDRLAVWMVVIAMVEVLYRSVANAVFGYTSARIYFGTDTHSDGLLIGCAAAFWMASKAADGLGRAEIRLHKTMTWAGMVALAVLFCYGRGEPPISGVAVIAAGVVITGFVRGGAPTILVRILSCRAAIWIGRRSYGLYLWQYVIYIGMWGMLGYYLSGYATGGPGRRMWVAGVDLAAIALSFTAAALSYRFVELPALRLKRRFDGRKPRPPEAEARPEIAASGRSALAP